MKYFATTATTISRGASRGALHPDGLAALRVVLLSSQIFLLVVVVGSLIGLPGLRGTGFRELVVFVDTGTSQGVAVGRRLPPRQSLLARPAAASPYPRRAVVVLGSRNRMMLLDPRPRRSVPVPILRMPRRRRNRRTPVPGRSWRHGLNLIPDLCRGNLVRSSLSPVCCQKISLIVADRRNLPAGQFSAMHLAGDRAVAV